MPTKLRNLRVKRVALVDEGANPDAHIRFAKNKGGAAEDGSMTEEEALSFVERFMEFMKSRFGPARIEKEAATFTEKEALRDMEDIMCDEVYPMNYAFMDSVRSIFFDTKKSEEEKRNLLAQTIKEFSDAFIAAAQSWVAGKSSDVKVEKDNEALVKMRDQLTEMIEKGCGGKKPVKKEDDPEDDDPEEESEEPDGDSGDAPDDAEKKCPVKKGEVDMIFDTAKMTPEDRATFDELAKRYANDQTPPAAPAPAPAPAADSNPAPAEDDVYKGLHPAVKAELESLRKFREDSEMRELTEVAKKYTLLGKKPEELAPVLKSLRDAGGTAYADMISILDSNLDAVEKSGVYNEIGKRGNSGSDDPWAKIETAAQEIVKSKPEMRWPDAVDAACMAHPELVEEYEKSRR